MVSSLFITVSRYYAHYFPFRLSSLCYFPFGSVIFTLLIIVRLLSILFMFFGLLSFTHFIFSFFSGKVTDDLWQVIQAKVKKVSDERQAR